MIAALGAKQRGLPFLTALYGGLFVFRVPFFFLCKDFAEETEFLLETDFMKGLIPFYMIVSFQNANLSTLTEQSRKGTF